MSQRSIVEPYDSPYAEQRKKEYDNMEFERIQRECWVNILAHNINDEPRLKMLSNIEENIKGQLADNYNANRVVFDREKRKITFEIDMEEIEL